MGVKGVCSRMGLMSSNCGCFQRCFVHFAGSELVTVALKFRVKLWTMEN